MRKVALLTREYPPDVYGGAGVHVEYLARELARVAEVTVHCWGAERPPVAGGPTVVAHLPWGVLAGQETYAPALQALSIDLAMAAGAGGADLVHSHTWYANLGGHLAGLVHGIPHVATVHSLEPMRPWKREQLGGGYAVSSFAEQTALEAADAIIAVSAAHLREILSCYPAIDPARTSVIYNGIDADEYRPDPRTDVLERHGIDPVLPSVVFVGRITRQKGLTHLLDAAPAIDPAAQLVLCAGAPDTPEIAAEISAKLERVRATRGNVVWIEEMLPKRDVIQILGHATVFACPSVYEPMGIVNLEAMACETAVVATAVGGIPEVVEDGVTGLLVPYEARPDGTGTPVDPAGMAAGLATHVNEILADPARARAMGVAGRARAVEHFGWDVAAAETFALYERLLAM
jgi:starch synthase